MSRQRLPSVLASPSRLGRWLARELRREMGGDGGTVTQRRHILRRHACGARQELVIGGPCAWLVNLRSVIEAVTTGLCAHTRSPAAAIAASSAALRIVLPTSVSVAVTRSPRMRAF